MPKGAVINGLSLADIPAELKDLNILERHLIAKAIPFAKIIPLPKGGQRAIRGNVVCVPSEMQETVDALPRLRGQSQVMSVKLKRNINFRGHQLFQTVTWSKLIQALHKLKTSTHSMEILLSETTLSHVIQRCRTRIMRLMTLMISMRTN